MKASEAVASFDSATGMLRALSRFLAGRDIPALGKFPAAFEPPLSGLLGTLNRLPIAARERAYAVSGWAEAIPQRRVGDVRSEALAEWVTGHYPRRRYPVIFIGSANGALIHLAAALDAAWLPQTLLLPVRRRGITPDDPRGDLAAVGESGRALLAANPDLVLHHMHDPNQDRLMIAGMTYFRIKWRRLPAAYRRFIRDHLVPGGLLVCVDCTLSWPTTRIDDRYVFQFGALGDATPEEYRQGGPRVADLLSRYGAPVRRWDPPAADGESPEAEWGLDPALLDDLRAFTGQHRLDTQLLRFDTPQRLSPAVADLYRSWYADRGLPTGRLLVESFLLLEPWWTLRTGSVPYWTVFGTEASRASLEAYLDASDPYDEIRILLFNHGTESIGLADAQDWRRTAARARKIGVLTGVDAVAYPRDFASFVRSHRELSRIRTRYPLPLPLDAAGAAATLSARDDILWRPVH
ncbi:hypothetical protein SSP24_00230 [Streptomyces spinoverrucosus]|uniref:Transferase n=1 Tax=Streptomyces spinoverrucosus TaxID=284043 RepID=A0A4Y3V876_9ACTN|nr:hypothetical protein [Streptomyces spinoverrucosus]GEC02368.1 hypothetical protein SSP24_00230 [Streptomyces spinoverrucosus]GHB43465.1 hypothetical protein GCM10010397_12360 [Streptomyces spinoverrucosus]